jgi:HTH-type transcriptional regulator/antitoxin HipB
MENRKKPAHLETTSFDELKDELYGKRGTSKREALELDLAIDLLGQQLKMLREEKNLSQEELGEVVGVKKAQISKIENGKAGAKFETVVRLFKALGAVTVQLHVELKNHDPVDLEVN